jgi:hypothetical protein
MWAWILGGIAIVAVVGGFYWFIDGQLSSKDKTISDLQTSLAAKIIDYETVKKSYEQCTREASLREKSLKETFEQLSRLQKLDAAERKRQAEFDQQVQGLDIQAPGNLEKINKFQDCLANKGSECEKLLR